MRHGIFHHFQGYYAYLGGRQDKNEAILEFIKFASTTGTSCGKIRKLRAVEPILPHSLPSYTYHTKLCPSLIQYTPANIILDAAFHLRPCLDSMIHIVFAQKSNYPYSWISSVSTADPTEKPKKS
jgi:hypothetical protein